MNGFSMCSIVGSLVPFLFAAHTVAAAAPPRAAQRPVDDLVATATTLTAAEMASIARHFDAPEYLVFPGNQRGVTFVGGFGDLMRIGQGFGLTVALDTVIAPGIYWNHAPDPAFVHLAGDDELTEIPSGAFLVVGDMISDNRTFPDRPRRTGTPVIVHANVSVACGEGYYACCTGTGGSSYKAKCRKTGVSDANCVSGGEGASSCVIGDP